MCKLEITISLEKQVLETEELLGPHFEKTESYWNIKNMNEVISKTARNIVGGLLLLLEKKI